ncbi:MAG: hypothetical protein WBB15_11955, partial [Ornithinimicrobium sp.]
MGRRSRPAVTGPVPARRLPRWLASASHKVAGRRRQAITTTGGERNGSTPFLATNPPVGGPVSAGWREGTLTRVKELTTLCDWAATTTDVAGYWIFVESIQQ